jgi:aminotransferase
MEKIAKLAIEYDLTVISDEVYSRLTYEGEHTCFASLPEMNERTVLLNGFSKSYSMTGWRVGYLCGPAQIVEAALRVNQYAELSAPTVAQHAAIEALKNGEESLNRNVSQLDQLRRYTCSRLDEIGLTFSRPAGAFFVFPDVSTTGLDGEEFALRLLSEQKVVVIPGNIFGNGCENRVRITYANTQKTMRDALDRIEAFVKNL